MTTSTPAQIEAVTWAVRVAFERDILDFRKIAIAAIRALKETDNMLYNPQWDKDITLPAITKWLETKPADETYNVFVLEECLLGQYLQFEGVPYEGVGEKSAALTNGSLDMRKLVFGPDTFGAALRRAKALTAAK